MRNLTTAADPSPREDGSVCRTSLFPGGVGWCACDSSSRRHAPVDSTSWRPACPLLCWFSSVTLEASRRRSRSAGESQWLFHDCAH